MATAVELFPSPQDSTPTATGPSGEPDAPLTPSLSPLPPPSSTLAKNNNGNDNDGNDDAYAPSEGANAVDRENESSGDVDSTISLTDSLRELLLTQEEKPGTRYSTLSTDYCFPVNTRVAEVQRFTHLYRCGLQEGKPYFEPEGRKGTIHKLLQDKQDARVLDLGCGIEGAWVVAMAELYPHVEVSGVDLYMPSDRFAPPNVIYEIHDCSETLPYPDACFDVIHLRGGGTWLTDRALYHHHIARCLRPGGVLLIEGIYTVFYDSTGSPLSSKYPHLDHNTVNFRDSICHPAQTDLEKFLRLSGDWRDVNHKIWRLDVGRRWNDTPEEAAIGEALYECFSLVLEMYLEDKRGSQPVTPEDRALFELQQAELESVRGLPRGQGLEMLASSWWAIRA